MRRLGALCLLVALAAGPATTILAAVASGTGAAESGHHHPGCPWEMRDEPCPHDAPPATPDAPAIAPCPPMNLHAPLAAGPDLAPPAPGVDWTPAGDDVRPDAPSGDPASDVRPTPDPRPPRETLPIVRS